MSIGRVMDWIEARQEGLRVAAMGEEDEEEERSGGTVPRAASSQTKNCADMREGRERHGRNTRSTQVSQGLLST